MMKVLWGQESVAGLLLDMGYPEAGYYLLAKGDRPCLINHCRVSVCESHDTGRIVKTIEVIRVGKLYLVNVENV